MNQLELIKKIREHLHDPDGKIWDDKELSDMIESAAESYSTDTGIFRGRVYFRVDPDGICRAPMNYLVFLSAWNVKNSRVECISVGDVKRFYPDYIQKTGDSQFVYEDLDQIGSFRFCPNPYPMQNLSVSIPKNPYGIMILSGYGIPKNTQSYGIPLKIYQFLPIGDLVYIKRESAENIPDYMALIYHVLYQAYLSDSDFSNSSKAAFFKYQYESRIAFFGQMKPGNHGIKKRGKFF